MSQDEALISYRPDDEPPAEVAGMRWISDKYTCIVIGKPVGGISLNGPEYLKATDGQGWEAPFVDKDDAVAFLHWMGMTDEQIEAAGIVFETLPLEPELSGVWYTYFKDDRYAVFNEAPNWIYEGKVYPMTIDRIESGPFSRFSDAFRDATKRGNARADYVSTMATIELQDKQDAEDEHSEQVGDRLRDEAQFPGLEK